MVWLEFTLLPILSSVVGIVLLIGCSHLLACIYIHFTEKIRLKKARRKAAAKESKLEDSKKALIIHPSEKEEMTTKKTGPLKKRTVKKTKYYDYDSYY